MVLALGVVVHFNLVRGKERAVISATYSYKVTGSWQLAAGCWLSVLLLVLTVGAGLRWLVPLSWLLLLSVSMAGIMLLCLINTGFMTRKSRLA